MHHTLLRTRNTCKQRASRAIMAAHRTCTLVHKTSQGAGDLRELATFRFVTRGAGLVSQNFSQYVTARCEVKS